MQITCTQGKIMVFCVMDMKNKLLAERARYLKENDNGVKHMCRIIEDQEKEANLEERLEMAAKILESGKMAEEELTEMFKFTAKQLQSIKERVAVLA